MNVNKYIGSKIRYYRTQKNITQEELAEHLNTTSQTISRYENGERKTNQDILFELAAYFGVSINDFFPETVNDEDEDKRFDNILFSKTRELSDESKDIVLSLVDKLSKADKSDD